MKKLEIPILTLKADPKNPRKISSEALDGLATSLETFGPLDIVFNETTGELVSGHQRIASLRKAGASTFTRNEGEDYGHIVHPKTAERFPVRFVRWDETKQRMANLVANNPHLQGAFDDQALEQLRALEDEIGFAEMGLDKLAAELEGEKGESVAGDQNDGAGTLSDRFGVPPFTVLDARQGYWQDRKRQWLALGIQSELGRGETAGTGGGYERDDSPTAPRAGQTDCAPGGSARPACDYRKRQRGSGNGRPIQ